MKKRTVLVMALIALFAIFTMTASAATPSERIVDAAKTFPLESHHIVQVENCLANIAAAGIEITDAQADAIIAVMEELRPYASSEEDLHNLSAEKRAEVLALLNKGAGIIGCSVRFVDDRDGIFEVVVISPSGESLGVFSSDNAIKHTGYENTALVVAASVAMLSTVAAVAVFRKKGQLNAA